MRRVHDAAFQIVRIRPTIPVQWNTMSGFRVRFFKKVLGGNGHEGDACQYSFETLANTRAEAEERAKKAFCEIHHLMNWTIHADRFLNSCAYRDPKNKLPSRGPRALAMASFVFEPSRMNGV